MSSTDPQQNASVPEMGRFQRQIVDNALEEAQFQSAIDALDQLRSPDHKPSVYAIPSYCSLIFLTRYKQNSHITSSLPIVAPSTRGLSERR